MIYLDTSVVVALLTPEERSPLALDWFGQCRAGARPVERPMRQAGVLYAT